MRVFHDQQIKIKRLKATTGNLRNYVATATADCNLQPLGKDRTQVDAGVFGSSYIAYVDAGVSVIVGDRVVGKDGTAYSVTQVIERDIGAFPYKEILLKKQ